MQDTLKRPLNLEDEVAPNHWKPTQFERFSRMSVDEEFDALAPLFVYFWADCERVTAAREGVRLLKAADHPLLAGYTAEEAIETHTTPAGLAARYTALVLAIAEEEVPGIGSYIDQWGAYAFNVPGHPALLAGSVPGSFAFFERAQALRQCLRLAAQTLA